jgi:hypothetical protein
MSLLRALASLGVFAEPSPQQYALAPVSELLRRDVPGSMRDWLIAEMVAETTRLSLGGAEACEQLIHISIGWCAAPSTIRD